MQKQLQAHRDRMESHDGTHVQFKSFHAGDSVIEETPKTKNKNAEPGFGNKQIPQMEKETYGLPRELMNKLQAEIDYRRQAMQIEALMNKKKALQPLYDLNHQDDYEDGEEQ